jgi:hypothetical protein
MVATVGSAEEAQDHTRTTAVARPAIKMDRLIMLAVLVANAPATSGMVDGTSRAVAGF